MIKNFRDTWLEIFFIDGIKNMKTPSIIADRLFRKLQILDDSTCDVDLRSPPSNNFEKLTGELKGWCSMRVNNQWRLIFQWDNERGEAENVYLDNHSYR
jgi:proteic killer suppression protein